MTQPQYIRMDRADLHGLPARREPPAGYELLTYSDDLLEPWLALLDAVFPEYAPFNRERWRERIVQAPQFWPDGTFFIRHTATGELCACAYAWIDDPAERELARVEWVAALEAHRGKGLGRLVTELVLHYMADHAYSAVMLETEPPLLPAINLYLSLGFVPTPRNEKELAHWRECLATLRHPTEGLAIE